MIERRVQPPVEIVETGSRFNRGDRVMPGTALCLSGGEYRAMLVHLRALWRLNEAGYLSKLDRVSSVSGGSITAALLGLTWARLSFDAAGVATRFVEAVVSPIRALANGTIDEGAIISGLLLRGSIADKVTAAYRKELFGEATSPTMVSQTAAVPPGTR